MCGKSVWGNGGNKIAYYEHGWLTKKNGCLLKPAYKCDPYRIQSKVIEPLVWEKIEDLLKNPKVAEKIIASAKKQFEKRSNSKDLERAKTRVYELGHQLDALAERLSELPKSVSATTIYKQMERIQELKDEEEKRLESLRQNAGDDQLPLDFKTYENFIKRINSLRLQTETKFSQARIIRSLVHRIEISKDSFKIFFLTTKDHIEWELSKRSPDSIKAPGENFLSNSSRSLTNGAPTKP